MLEQGIVHPVFGPEPVFEPAEKRRHWFAVLAVLAEIGGVVMLRAADAHRLIGHM
jgi:hypothetical protein